MTDARGPTSQDALRSVFEAAALVTTERNLQGVLDRVVAVARELMHCRYAALALWEGDRIAEFITSGIAARDILLIGELPKGHGLMGEVVREGRVLRMRDMQADPRSVGFPPHHPEMHSFLGVPIAFKDDVMGDLYLTEKIGADEFTFEDESAASGVAALAAVAIKNAQLLETQHEVDADQLERIKVFISTAGHELAQPTQAVGGLLSTLLARWEELDDGERHAFVERAERQARVLRVGFDGLMDIQRVEQGFTPDCRETDLRALAREAVELLPGAFRRRVTVESERALCSADEDQILRAVSNLLTNACKFSTGDVRVVVEPVQDGATLSVTDGGIGFEPAEAEKLFEPSYRTEAARRFPGIGMGLHIVRRIVNAHGGTLSAESAGPGKGSTFRMFIPLLPVEINVQDENDAARPRRTR